MKSYQMLLFFLIVIAIYTGVNWFVFNRGSHALSGTGYQALFAWIYWLLAGSFVAGMVLERTNPGSFASAVSFVGSFWLAIFFYLLMSLLVIDLVRLFQYLTHLIPQEFLQYPLLPQRLFVLVAGAALFISLAGFINARIPAIRDISLDLSKGKDTTDSLKVVMVSDVHLGAIIGKKQAAGLVKRINAQQPDLVLIAGDLVDHNPDPVIMEDMGSIFETIQSTYGVYAIAGNHEFIGHAEKSISYFEKHGVKYLRDTLITIADKIQLAGRDDKDKPRFTGEARKPLQVILLNRKADLPLILMDHQPVEYQQAADAKVDLMLSGHTHKGQLWPLSYVTNAMFENHYGLYQKAGSWFYTSSGYGSWGPPVRVGHRPELVVFQLKH